MLVFVLVAIGLGCASVAVESAEHEPAPAPLARKDFRRVMQDMESALEQVRDHVAASDSLGAADATDRLAANAARVWLYGEVTNDGTAIRAEADFKAWAAELEGRIDRMRQNIATGDWKAAAEARANVGKTCAACHGKYDPRPW
jgi:cytochrome c556